VLPRLLRIAGAACYAGLAAACGGTTTEEIVGPEAVRCQISVTAPPQTLPHDSASVPLAVTTTRDCTWTASTDASWVQINPTSGQGNGAVTAAVAANTQTRSRTGTIAINDTTVSISQAGVPCRFELSSERVRTGFEGGHTSLRVFTTDACEWRASSGERWIRVLTDRGTGPGSVELEIDRNEGSERSATVTIAERAVVVSQAAFSAAPPPPPLTANP